MISIIEKCGNKELGKIGEKFYIQKRLNSGRFEWKYYKTEGRARKDFNCNINLSGMVMACSDYKKVKTNPEGRFGGKEISRCKKYLPSDLSTCIPGKSNKPKLNGFAGEIMSCNVWEKVNKKWRCKSFLPTCQKNNQENDRYFYYEVFIPSGMKTFEIIQKLEYSPTETSKNWKQRYSKILKGEEKGKLVKLIAHSDRDLSERIEEAKKSGHLNPKYKGQNIFLVHLREGDKPIKMIGKEPKYEPSPKEKSAIQKSREETQEKRAEAWGVFNSKEPYNLTREQWDLIKLDLQAENLQTDITKHTASEQANKHEMRLKLRYGCEGAYDPDIGWYSGVTHKDVIIKAILEGKKVTENVIKDYPNIEKEIYNAANTIELPESKLKPWQIENPFTKDDLGRYNAYKWTDRDLNKDFNEIIRDVENKTTQDLVQFGINQWPENLKSALNLLRKAYYDYFQTDIRLGLYYPSPAVVGPSKFPFHRREKFLRRDKENTDKLTKAKNKYWNVVHDAHKGMMKASVLNSYLEKALSMDRVSFGKYYAEIQQKAAPQSLTMETWGNVWRQQGRELHERLIGEAIKQNIPLKWEVIKTYNAMIPNANIVDRPASKEPIPDVVYRDNKARYIKSDLLINGGKLKYIEIPEKSAKNDVYYLIPVKDDFYLLSGKLLKHELLPGKKLFFGRNPSAKYTNERFMMIDGDTGRKVFNCSGLPTCKDYLNLHLYDKPEAAAEWVKKASEHERIPKPVGILDKLNSAIIESYKKIGEIPLSSYELPQFME